MVFDTMVLVYAVLKVPGFGEEAIRAVRAAADLRAPDSVRAELASAIWKYALRDRLPAATALASLFAASGLLTEVVDTRALWSDALAIAIAEKHPPYDTLFVALARARGEKVLTYDAELLRRFPDFAITPAQYLASAG